MDFIFLAWWRWLKIGIYRMYREFSQLYDEGMLYATVIGADLKTANHVQC
jgi:hypothetical protein